MIDKNVHGSILHLQMSEKLNILSYDLSSHLAEALKKADEDPSIYTVILSGSEKAFSVGADLKEIVNKNAAEFNQWIEPWEKIARFSKPLIMSLKGYVLGGGLEFVLMGDILIAHPQTVFASPEIKLGLIPGCGATQRLVQAIGYHRAFSMCVLGEQIPAASLYEWGLLNLINEDPLKASFDFAEKLLSFSLESLQKAKKALRFSLDNVIEQGLSIERNLFNELLESENVHQKLKTFVS
jgi:enoyl-CoA hydratase